MTQLAKYSRLSETGVNIIDHRTYSPPLSSVSLKARLDDRSPLNSLKLNAIQIESNETVGTSGSFYCQWARPNRRSSALARKAGGCSDSGTEDDAVVSMAATAEVTGANRTGWRGQDRV